jgi:hypothetical protein
MMGIKNFRIGLPCVLWLALSLGFVLVPTPLLAGNTTGTTRTQTYQPGEPFTGLPGGAPGRGYGTSPYGTPYGVVPYGTPYGVNPYGAPSVYCQNWPGHSPYPQYPGTGPNTPCGPAFQPQPQPQPPQPQPPQTTSCSDSVGFLDEPDVIEIPLGGVAGARPILAAASARSAIRVREQSDLLLLIDAPQGSGLIIGNKTVNETPDNYRCIIRFLTVPEDRWSTSVFQQGTNIAAIRQLEDPTRRKIYNAMANSTRYPVIFSSLDKAQENFKIRLAVISFMTNLPTYCQWVGSNNPTMNSKYWTDQPDPSGARGVLFQTKSGVLASKAIEAIGQDGTGRYLECLATVEIAILYAVERVIGAQRFNAEHPGPYALQAIGEPGSSLNGAIYKNVQMISGPISSSDIIPGDWAYLQNTSQSAAQQPAYWAWRGENAIYLGNGFSGGGGINNVTEQQLRKLLYDYAPSPKPLPSELSWTLLARPIAGD